jgi:hypothetical protein
MNRIILIIALVLMAGTGWTFTKEDIPAKVIPARSHIYYEAQEICDMIQFYMKAKGIPGKVIEFSWSSGSQNGVFYLVDVEYPQKEGKKK